MTKQEVEILQQISITLRASTKPNWERGALTDWTNFARHMRSVINNSTGIIDTILKTTHVEGKSAPIEAFRNTDQQIKSIPEVDINSPDKIEEIEMKTPVWKNGKWE